MIQAWLERHALAHRQSPFDFIDGLLFRLKWRWARRPFQIRGMNRRIWRKPKRLLSLDMHPDRDGFAAAP